MLHSKRKHRNAKPEHHARQEPPLVARREKSLLDSEDPAQPKKKKKKSRVSRGLKKSGKLGSHTKPISSSTSQHSSRFLGWPISISFLIPGWVTDLAFHLTKLQGACESGMDTSSQSIAVT